MAIPANGQQTGRTVDVGVFFDNIKKQCANNGLQTTSTEPESITDLFTKYDGTVRSTKTSHQQLQEIRDELVARIRGRNIGGRLENRSGMPSEAELEAMEAREAEVFRPLTEDVVETINTRKDGTVVRNKFTIAQIMQALQQKAELKTTELEGIHAEIEQVSAEIDSIASALESGTDPGIQRAKARLDAELKRIDAAERDAEEQYQADLAKLEEEEKESKAAFERELQELMDRFD